MSTKLLMGNQAIAYGALAAGVNLVAGYPGTPSTEVLETIAELNPNQQVHVEWSTNEKAALEVAAGAAYCGARCLVTMKQVGLNVAADPLMSLRYVGVKGGLVLVVADDPGPISSQTEQDTRRMGAFSKVPVLDPSSPEEAYEMARWAFELSEEYHTPVILRPTTRVCHGSANVRVTDDPYTPHEVEGFVPSSDWVIFPKLSFQAHQRITSDLFDIAAAMTESGFSEIMDYPLTIGGPSPTLGIATNGISFAYVEEALEILSKRCEAAGQAMPPLRVLKMNTPYPFDFAYAATFLNELGHGLTDVLVLEELDHVIEDELLKTAGMMHLDTVIHGKMTQETRCAGENSVESVMADLQVFLGLELPSAGVEAGAGAAEAAQTEQTAQNTPSEPLTPPEPPVRPPVLCAGCPHRASFLAAKKACKGRDAVFSGDIGCYTLGNAAPLNAVDTCLCMGAGITIPQGMAVMDSDKIHLAFVGDSTFFASGMTGVANAVYNDNKVTVVILDNSITAMTGGQPHPGTGVRMTGATEEDKAGLRALSIPSILQALGCTNVTVVNPFQQDEAVEAVRQAIDSPGINAVVMKAPCVNLFKSSSRMLVDQEACQGCLRCIKQVGCPAIGMQQGKVVIDQTLCNGCGLCQSACAFGALTLREGGQA